MLKIALALVAASQLAACSASMRPELEAVAARSGTQVRTIASQYGTILGDGRGQAVYVFDRERTAHSACYGACAKAWPPVLTDGRPVAGRGVRASLLGTTRRRDGRPPGTPPGPPPYLFVAPPPRPPPFPPGARVGRPGAGVRRG